METTWQQDVFDRELDRYIAASSKELPTILNSKAYFVARKALWFTDKAAAVKIRRLEKMKGRNGGHLVGSIINKRRKAKGENGLYGKEMKVEVDRLIAARLRSVAFLKSGWIPAIRFLDPKAQDKQLAGPTVRGATQYGRPKGTASAATEAVLSCVIQNLAQAKSDRINALTTIGGRGLNRAFLDEAASMVEYVEKKMKKHADEANRRL